MISSLLPLLVLAHYAAAQLFPNCTSGPLSNNTVCNTNANTIDRATALVNAMTIDEKFNRTGSVSPGVPRLGLPSYQWWQEALVNMHLPSNPKAGLGLTLHQAWRCNLSRCQLQLHGRLFTCDVFPAAYLDERSLRRPVDQRRCNCGQH